MKVTTFVSLTLTLTSCVCIAMATIFTSSYKLAKMALKEETILSTLKEHMSDARPELRDWIEKLLQETRLKSKSQRADELNHPNSVYHVIKRLALDYVTLFPGVFEAVRDQLEQGKPSIKMATQEDFQSALSALLRMQEIYLLETSDMIQGNYLGHPGPVLTFRDAYYLGQKAFSSGKNLVSVDWLETALEERQKSPDVVKNPKLPPTVGDIKALLGRNFVRLQDVERASALLKEAKTHAPRGGETIELKKELKSLPFAAQPIKSQADANYSRLCQYRDAYHIESPDYKAMKCRYRSSLLPYYVFREEILSATPYVSLFYDFVTDKERKHLVAKASFKLSSSTVKSTRSADVVDTDMRICDTGWLHDKDYSATARLTRRIGLATGLAVNQQSTNHFSSEPFQVVNYGMGGHYVPHLDPIILPDGDGVKDLADESGHRLATFLLYLNSVMEGGNTVFVKAGISVAARQDTALFWYSYPPAFDKVDALTEHAGCPVMVGQKWIANKWIRSYGNSFHRPCGTTSNQTQLDLEKLKANNLNK